MIRLLPLQDLVRTGPVDHADWNYRPVLGILQRRRFQLATALLPRQSIQRLLEVGYGSGVFLPELARHCEELHGIDTHASAADVLGKLLPHGVAPSLAQGSAEALPYDDGFFDCIVAVSALEFVPDIDSAARELARVLKPSGRLVLVTPGHSPLLDWGLRFATGARARHDYAHRRERLLPALSAHFSVEAKRQFPPLLSRALCLYTALRMKPA